jgi:hypothetical protein
MGNVSRATTDNAGPVGSEMVHQLNSLDTVSEIRRVQVCFNSSLRSAATPSTGVVEIRMVAKAASLSRVTEAIAPLTKGIIPILIATLTLFILIVCLRLTITLP